MAECLMIGVLSTEIWVEAYWDDRTRVDHGSRGYIRVQRGQQ